MKNTLTSCLILLLLVFNTAHAQQSDNSSIVRIIASVQKDHPIYPWQKLRPTQRSGFGVVIDESHVLTTENLVRNNTLIEIQHPHSGKKITATLVKSDHQVNLALLHIEDNTSLAEINYPIIKEDLPLESTVDIIQIDETSGIQKGDGVVVKALVESLPTAAFSILQYDILTDLNVNGEGAPVFYNNQLAGIMISYSASSRTGRMTPATFITHFIDDALDDPYIGFASAGFAWTPLVDPIKRKYLGVNAPENGIQVLSCLPGTGAGKALKPNDVILTWDGHQIDDLGYYIDDNFGRLLFPHLITSTRAPGDEATATIVRDGATQQVQVPLSQRNEENDLIPENTIESPREYIIAGGLVIQELNAQMLYAYGQKWQSRVNPRLAHLYLTKQQSPEKTGDHIVLLTNVLNDPINISYQQLQNMIIEKVNGKNIRNINDVFDIIDADGSIKTISLHATGVDIVLDQNTLELANQRIINQYRLPALQRRVKR